MQQAVLARDFKRAAKAMRLHLNETTRILLKARHAAADESPQRLTSEA
jgi:DNA-binding GntR family transcriptional regulator